MTKLEQDVARHNKKLAVFTDEKEKGIELGNLLRSYKAEVYRLEKVGDEFFIKGNIPKALACCRKSLRLVDLHSYISEATGMTRGKWVCIESLMELIDSLEGHVERQEISALIG